MILVVVVVLNVNYTILVGPIWPKKPSVAVNQSISN